MWKVPDSDSCHVQLKDSREGLSHCQSGYTILGKLDQWSGFLTTLVCFIVTIFLLEPDLSLLFLKSFRAVLLCINCWLILYYFVAQEAIRKGFFFNLMVPHQNAWNKTIYSLTPEFICSFLMEVPNQGLNPQMWFLDAYCSKAHTPSLMCTCCISCSKIKALNTAAFLEGFLSLNVIGQTITIVPLIWECLLRIILHSFWLSAQVQ